MYELLNITNWGDATHLLQSALNYTSGATTGRVITSTTAPQATTFTLELFNSGAIGGVAKTTSRAYFCTRTFTLTELGL